MSLGAPCLELGSAIDTVSLRDCWIGPPNDRRGRKYDETGGIISAGPAALCPRELDCTWKLYLEVGVDNRRTRMAIRAKRLDSIAMEEAAKMQSAFAMDVFAWLSNVVSSIGEHCSVQLVLFRPLIKCRRLFLRNHFPDEMGNGSLQFHFRNHNLWPAFHFMRDCNPRGVLLGPDRPCLDPFQASAALLRHRGLQHWLGQLEVGHAAHASTCCHARLSSYMIHPHMPL